MKKSLLIILFFVLSISLVSCKNKSGKEQLTGEAENITNPEVERIYSDNSEYKKDGYAVYTAEYDGLAYEFAVPDIEKSDITPIGAEVYGKLASDAGQDARSAENEMKMFEKGKIPVWADKKKSMQGKMLIWYKLAMPEFIFDKYPDDFGKMMLENIHDNKQLNISEGDVWYLYVNMYEQVYNCKLKIEIYGRKGSSDEYEKYIETIIEKSGDYYVDCREFRQEKECTELMLKMTFAERVTKEQAFCFDGFQNVISDEAGYTSWKKEHIDIFIR